MRAEEGSDISRKQGQWAVVGTVHPSALTQLMALFTGLVPMPTLTTGAAGSV